MRRRESRMLKKEKLGSKFSNLALFGHAVVGAVSAFATTFAMVGTVALSVVFALAGAVIAYTATNEIPESEE